MAVHWLVTALASSVLWGVVYSISGYLYHKNDPIHPFTTLFWTAAVGVVVYFSLGYRVIVKDTKNIIAESNILYLVVFEVICSILGYIFICIATKDANATVVSMVEITYPFFVLIFSYYFFGEGDLLTTRNLLGGGLILSGIFVLWS